MRWICAVVCAFGLTAAAAWAAEPLTEWTEPYVVQVQLLSGEVGRRLVPVPEQDWILIAAGRQVEIDVVGLDQDGRVFPEDRFAYALEPDWRCRGMLDVITTERGERVMVAGDQIGDCSVLLTVAGNLNFDREIRVRVGTQARRGYSRDEAELAARRLYRAILGREADSRGLAGATAEIQRGNIESQVAAMYSSNEYRVKRAGLSPAQRLEDLYQGLFGRSPDTRGVRAYLDQISRGQHVHVTLLMVRSEEFERKLLRELGQ